MRKLLFCLGLLMSVFISCKEDKKPIETPSETREDMLLSNKELSVKEVKYVNAKRGLNVRDKNGKKLGKLKNNSPVEILGYSNSTKTIKDEGLLLTGRTAKIKYQDSVAYVFEGFLVSKLPSDLIIEKIMKEYDLNDGMSISRKALPSYLKADFNGQGEDDYAILVEYNNHVVVENGYSTRVFIVHTEDDSIYLLGDGNKMERENFTIGWMTNWKVFNEKEADELYLDENDKLQSRKIKLQHPAIQVSKEEGGSGFIYWDSGKYIWLGQGC